MKYKTLVRRRRDNACPILSLVFTIMTYYLFGVYRIWREPQQRGWTPRERLACNWAFPMKITGFRYNAGIVTTLSISYDECRRPRRGAPAADRWLQKNSLPAVPRRGPDAGVHRQWYDFHGSGVSWILSCLFLQSQKKENLLLLIGHYSTFDSSE